jgi:3-oxoacyl-[acyl-carrier-protein] synthase III
MESWPDMTAYVRSIAVALPSNVQSNEQLCEGVPGWTAEKIVQKTGILSRRIAGENETSADLAAQAAEALLSSTSDGPAIERDQIDALIFVSQSPDYFVPATACGLQSRLRLSQQVAAFDLNQGCSGYLYGLWVAQALVQSGAARRVLVLTAETYSRYCTPQNIAVASLFGDAAAATLVTSDPTAAWAELGPIVLGTDGTGVEHLLVPGGGHRHPLADETHPRQMFMNGAAVAGFAVGYVKGGIERVLSMAQCGWNDIDRFLFHQANPGFIQRLTAALHLPAEKVPIDLADVGNCGSATIPLLISRLHERGALQPGNRCVLAGFGTGFSWGMGYAQWLAPTA